MVIQRDVKNNNGDMTFWDHVKCRIQHSFSCVIIIIKINYYYYYDDDLLSLFLGSQVYRIQHLSC